MALHGGYAYVADVDGLSVYAVEPGGRLELLRHVPTAGAARDVAVAGKRLYVADGRAGLACFSLEHPERPELLAYHALKGMPLRVRGSEQGVAVLQEGGTLSLVRPGRPPEHLSLPGLPSDAVWMGSHLYVADSGDGLLRVEVEPGPPRVTWRDRARRWATSLATRGSQLLVGSRDRRVVLLEASQVPPQVLAEVVLDHRPLRLDALGDQVLASGGDRPGAGATLLELSGPASLRVGTRLPFTALSAARLEPSLVLAARGAEGLELMRIAPSVSASARVEGLRLDRVAASRQQVVAWAEVGQGARAWRLGGIPRREELPQAQWLEAVPCGDAWCTLDVTAHLCRQQLSKQPGAPPACTRLAERGTAVAWQPGTRMVWLLDEAGGLQGWAFEQGWRRVAAAPGPSTATNERLSGLKVEGGRGVAIDPVLGRLQVFDLDVGTPRRRGAFLLQALPERVALSGGVALVAEPSAGLQVVDVTEPDRPRERAWVPMEPGPRDVAIWRPGTAGSEAWVALAQGEAGVSLWAWDGRGGLRLLRRSETSGVASGVTFADGALWVADGTGVVRYTLEPLP